MADAVVTGADSVRHTGGGAGRGVLGSSGVAVTTTAQIAADSALAGTYVPFSAWPASTTRLRAVALGDSTTAGGLKSVDGTVVQVGNTWAAMDGIGIQQAGNSSWFTWACLLSGGRILNVYNGGIASDTTVGMVARFTTDVLNKKPDVLFLGDAHNDFSVGSGITQQQTRDNIVAMIRLARLNGILPILGTCYPENNATLAPTLRKHNAWLKQLAAGRDATYPDVAHLYIVDRYSAVVDATSSTGAWTGSYTSDGTHPNVAGGIVAGQKVVNDLAGLLRGNTTNWGPFAATDNVQGSPNRIFNGLFITDTNADGLADSWTVSGGTSTSTIVTDSAVTGKVQQVAVTAGGPLIYQQLSVDGTNIAVGDRLKWAGLVKIAGASGTLNFIPQISFPGVATYTVQPLTQTAGIDFGWAYFEVEAVVPASATSLRAGVNVVSGTGTVSLAQQQIINLTRGI